MSSRHRAPGLLLASALAAVGALALTTAATPALAATQTLKVTVTGSGNGPLAFAVNQETAALYVADTGAPA